jgi:hypothetical protein
VGETTLTMPTSVKETKHTITATPVIQVTYFLNNTQTNSTSWTIEEEHDTTAFSILPTTTAAPEWELSILPGVTFTGNTTYVWFRSFEYVLAKHF